MVNINHQDVKYFDGQDPDEKVILVVRKHKLVLALSFFVAALLTLVIISFYATMSFSNILEDDTVRAGAVVVASIAFLYAIIYSFTGWLIKYLDILILTSKRLVIIEQHGLFRRKTSTLDLSAVQDVSASQNGFIQTILKFGKIQIQTAGEMPNFVYKGAGDPCDIQDAIMDAKELYIKHNKNISSSVIEESQNNNQNI